ncbi:hypothetical protein EXIGLDRAFT_198380 [Exidia glandulosa HHB12029]|uniref:Uncharacterized protein n=1 Tax=Exidia glandulosa HHB12029 TaxID=1314781 RepID=A0A165MX63_EXIGL|nr:hypothetical protein EXIGLDRAFT_198380 [Exidia glandulosa HHB12029]
MTRHCGTNHADEGGLAGVDTRGVVYEDQRQDAKGHGPHERHQARQWTRPARVRTTNGEEGCTSRQQKQRNRAGSLAARDCRCARRIREERSLKREDEGERSASHRQLSRRSGCSREWWTEGLHSKLWKGREGTILHKRVKQARVEGGTGRPRDDWKGYR